MSSPKCTPIILSLKDDRFKSIAYRHFRRLGTRRDKDAEKEAQRCLLDELTRGKEHGEVGPQFCKLKEDRMVFVTKEKAREFIKETFKRRLRTSHIWLEKNNSPQLSERESIQPLTINRREEGGAFSSDQSEDDETLASVAAQKAAAVTLKRKSPRLVEENAKKPAVTVSAVQSGSGKMKKRSPDIFLSMADPYYKQTIFHYFEQRKKGQTTTVQATKEIFSKFQNFLKKSKGDFYKSEHKGGEQCLVDNNDVVIRKIKTDLNKINRYEDEMASTIVLDLKRDAKFSSVMYKIYNSIESDATQQKLRDAAKQILDELKRKYSYYVRIVDGDRFEISDEESLILDIILQNMRRLNESKIRQPLKKSVLDSRLPNRKHLTITSRTPIKTVSQLIQILQLVTHKVNDLHGTHRCHCKVVRLHQLPELGGNSIGVPKLSEIAKYSGVSQSNIRNFFHMCQNAERRGVDLRLLGDDLIEHHSGIFEEEQRDVYLLEHSAEKAIEELISRVVFEHLDKLADYEKKAVRSSLDEVKESDDEINNDVEVDNGFTTVVVVESDEIQDHLNCEMDRDREKPILGAAATDNTTNDASQKINSLQTSVDSNRNIPKFEGLDTYSEIEDEEPAANVTDQSSPAHSQEQENEHLDRATSISAHNDTAAGAVSVRDKEIVDQLNADSLHSHTQEHFLKRSDSPIRTIEKIKGTNEIHSDTSDHIMVERDNFVEDVVILQDEHRSIKADTSTKAEKEANDSYNHTKTSIAQISDAIRPKHVMVEDCNAKELDSHCPNSPESATISKKDFVNSKKSSSNVSLKESMPECAKREQEARKAIPDVLSRGMRIGSRILVKWGRDGSLYRATVKKITMNKPEPSIKVHYDGKKSHILDHISLDMIQSLIPDQEDGCIDDDLYRISKTDQSNVALKDLLRGKYPNSLPDGKLEHREQCLELGPGWTVYIFARQNQGGKKCLRTNRYFIAPSGKSLRDTNELEKYRFERPDEFDICRIENDPDDVVLDELPALPAYTQRHDSGTSFGLNNEMNTGKRQDPQCQEIKSENEVHPFSHDSFSPLMMGHSGQSIEDSHSDREFLSSLMDEKGLLFGDDDDDNNSNKDIDLFPNEGCPETMKACALKPMTSCMKCSSPSPKGEGNDGTIKKIVHFAQEPESNNKEFTPQYKERKKALSPRMKHNKKSLIGGMVPLFALDIPTGAEFAGYLGDAPTNNDSDSENNEDDTLAMSSVSKKSSVPTVASEPPTKNLSLGSVREKNSNNSSFVRISPIALRYIDEAAISDSTIPDNVSRPHATKPDDAGLDENVLINSTNLRPHLKSLNTSPNEVATINSKLKHSAFVDVSKTPQQVAPRPIVLPSSSPLKKTSSESKNSESTQLFAFEYTSGQGDEASTRPKRKLKATVRYDPDMVNLHKNGCKTGSGFVCPRCDFVCEYSSKVCSECQLECYYEAGVGVVSLKERESITACQAIIPLAKKPKLSQFSRPEGVLCNCTFCDRHHFSIQGIYAHHGRVHGDSEGTKLDWSKVTFSCPFCKSAEKKWTLNQVEKHVRDHHPGCELVTPNTSRPSKNRPGEKGASPQPQSSLNERVRVTRVKQPVDSSESFTVVKSFPETFLNWSKLDHRSLLPDCKKDYPREIHNILEIIEEQCKAQEYVVETARQQRFKLCQAEADLEAKALDEDRVAYQRGIRERARLADAERIEKQRFTESQRLMAMQYEYENRNKKRTKDEIEAEKLCSKPIVFFSATGRHLPNEKNVCKIASCELCKNDSFYLRCILLDTEITTMKMNGQSAQSMPLTANVPMPYIAKIDKNYFSKAEEHFEDEAQEVEKRAKLSRRDVATSKRLRAEEDKLFKLRSNQRNLEFIDRYNAGALKSTWKTSR